MVTRIAAYDPESDDIGDEAFDEPTAGELPSNAAAALEAPELDPENVVDEGSVSWDDLTIDVQQHTPPRDGPGAGGNETGAGDNATGGDRNVTAAGDDETE